MSKRKCVRVALHRKVDYRHPKGNGSGTLENLSLKGCLIKGPTTLWVGTRLALDLWLPDQAQPVKIETGIVRWSKGNLLGISFQEISPDAKARIAYVFQLLDEAQRPESA